jgi:DNA-binding transcriptional LysR family regulator
MFLAVAAHGSLSGAAAATGASLSTVVRRLRALEQDLGITLVERGANAIALTEAGLAVRDMALPMLDAARGVTATAAALGSAAAGAVRITAIASVSMFLSAHGPELARAAAPARLEFMPTRRNLDIVGGEADIALRMHAAPETGDLVARRLGAIAFTVYRRVDGGADAVIAPPDEAGLRNQADLIARYGRDLPVAARIGDTPTRHQAVRAGLGAAVLACWLGDGDTLLERAPGIEPSVEDVVMIMRPQRFRAPGVTRVADAIAALFRRERDRLVGDASGR